MRPLFMVVFCAVDADERSEVLDRRILQDHLGQFLLPVAHGQERNRLRRLRRCPE